MPVILKKCEILTNGVIYIFLNKRILNGILSIKCFLFVFEQILGTSVKISKLLRTTGCAITSLSWQILLLLLKICYIKYVSIAYVKHLFLFA